uniref:Uncharacterized protein n=2 Tax=root TaxID=1 RepID=A0A8S5S4E6_9CAUD|nr:MAG TPA: hypothetical protein [Siphoviridae sp. ctBLh2]
MRCPIGTIRRSIRAVWASLSGGTSERKAERTMEREREYEGRLTAFYRTLEEAIGRLPAEVRASLYRPCAAECVRGDVLQEMRRQFEECGCDLDRQYARYGRTPYFFADVIEPGRVYEIGYPRCLCPQVAAGFTDAPTHCECSRESILFVLQDLLPGRDIRVECLGTVLSGCPECRFRVEVG